MPGLVDHEEEVLGLASLEGLLVEGLFGNNTPHADQNFALSSTATHPQTLQNMAGYGRSEPPEHD